MRDWGQPGRAPSLRAALIFAVAGLRGLLGQIGHRAVTVPACTTVPCPGRAMGLGGGPDTAWSIGPCRHGPAGHRAVPCPCRATGRADGPRAAWLSMVFTFQY